MWPSDHPVLWLYAVPLLAAWLVYLYRHRRRHQVSAQRLSAAVAAGLTEPASLHPVVDPARCLGSRACISACPEGDVIGIVDGRAALVNPAHCIGHGACRAACPMDAIRLVFGTATRGVDIPTVSPEFETNVAGIFIAGELGGMGLIRNAVEQGRQAVAAIARRDRAREPDCYDVLIVGAGPAGLAATLAAHDAGLRYLTVEQESLGGTVAQYPRGKIIMTSPVHLPMIGKVRLRETSKEALLAFWQDVERRSGVRIRYRERVESVSPQAGGFEVRTTAGTYRTRRILLAVGRRGTPRKLDVPGESLPKVVYRLIDPEQYRARRVLVVGGGDSALEAAATLAEDPQSDIALSYRGAAFSRAKQKNRERVRAAADRGRLRVIMNSNVERIEPERVVIEQQGKRIELPNDAVIVSVGGVLPTAFLEAMGIEVQTKFGTE